MSANSQKTFTTNILRICEFDSTSKNQLKNCNFYNEKTDFVFSDSSIVVTYNDSVADKSVETYKVNKKDEQPGLIQYFCSISNTNIIMYYYKSMNLIKIYYYNRKDRKTYVYSYLKSDK